MSRTPIPPIPRGLLGGKTQAALNAVGRQVSELGYLGGVDGTVQRFPNGATFIADQPPPIDYWFYAVLVNAGPGGQADFADARYWYQSVVLAQVSGAKVEDVTKPYMDNYSGFATWGVGTNMGEVIAGTHSLPVTAPNGNTGIPLGSGATLVKVRLYDAAKMGTGTQYGDGANTVAIIEPLSPPSSAGIRVQGAITGHTVGTSSTYWGPYSVLLTTGQTVNAYNALEPVVGTPGSLGVNIAADGTVNGGACIVQPIGNTPAGNKMDLTYDPSISAYWFALTNGAM